MPDSAAPAERKTEVARALNPVAAPIAATELAARPVIDAAPTTRGPQGPQVTPTPAKQVSLQELTPVSPREAMVDAPVAAASVTAPVPPPRALVVPPSFMDLPLTMEAPRKLGPDLATTQPGMAGPYARVKATPFELDQLLPPRSDTASDLPATSDQSSTLVPDEEPIASDQVLAQPAPLWRRALATLFDFAVLGGMVMAMLLLAVSIVAGKPVPNNLHGIDVFFFRLHPIAIPAGALTVVLALLYTTVGSFLLRGRTLGRLLLGIRLVDSSGKSPGLIRSVLRAIFALVSFSFFLAGFWLALFDRRGQTLHDKLTRTFVVRPV